MAHEITVEAANVGRRLDVLVRQLLPEVPLGTVMKWLRKGAVRVGGKKVAGNYRLALGDVVRVPVAPEPARTVSALPPPVVVYEDPDLLIVDKPAGLASQPGTGHEEDSLQARVVAYLGRVGAAPGERPGLVQRLDRDVSGLLPVGKHAVALRVLNEAARRGELDKRYVALVHGRVAQARGRIELPLAVLDEPDVTKPRTRVDPSGQTASTEYSVLERFDEATLVELRLGTGRTHQIRAHMGALGHPLVGDTRYAGSLRGKWGLGRVFLHAGRLALRHPVSGESLEFSVALPEELQALLMRLRRVGM